MSSSLDSKAEWLEPDGLGGFASGTVGGIRTRRYHAVLLTALKPPTGRVVLVNGYDTWVDSPNGSFALSSQLYGPGFTYPDGARRVESFALDPWPRWTFSLEDGAKVQQELFMLKGAAVTALSWRLVNPRSGLTLSLRPFISGRDYHSLHHENPVFNFAAQQNNGKIVWHPYEGLPGIIALSNGGYRQQPDWYRNFLYEEERNRGLDYAEDLATPGVFHWDLAAGEAVLILAAEGNERGVLSAPMPAASCIESLRERERARRKTFSTAHYRAADAYLVHRGEGKTIVAGYPWFTDWGRDTFIALRGLCLASGRLDEARDILVQWAGAVSEGMLPNLFPDQGDYPEYNSVDASLWYIIAVYDFLESMKRKGRVVSPQDLKSLHEATNAILTGYARGTRYRIHMDQDGLLAAGEKGVQLTWMDAKVGDWVVTPRIGKPVEVQALWLNALLIGSSFSAQWGELYERGRRAFTARFWNAERDCLYDVVDVDHQSGTVDAALRPNQTLAVGGLPYTIVDGERARRIVDRVEEHLWTPVGLRSLAPGEPGYVPHYEGGVRERDGAYHQGTVWPWLMGPFVDAWVRVRGSSLEAKQEARERFLEPLLAHLNTAGLGHVSEIAAADPPHTPRGCPFQAWSMGELLRIELSILA